MLNNINIYKKRNLFQVINIQLKLFFIIHYFFLLSYFLEIAIISQTRYKIIVPEFLLYAM